MNRARTKFFAWLDACIGWLMGRFEHIGERFTGLCA